MSNTNKGWVVVSLNTGRFIQAPADTVLSSDLSTHYVEGLSNAHVFNTRELARDEKAEHEHILRVRIENGKAVEIIRRH